MAKTGKPWVEPTKLLKMLRRLINDKKLEKDFQEISEFHNTHVVVHHPNGTKSIVLDPNLNKQK